MTCEHCGLEHRADQPCNQSERPPLAELNADQCAARMDAISEEVERLSNRDDLTDDDERRWAELVNEFERVDERRRSLLREADLRRVRRALNNGGRESGAEPSDPIGEPRSVGRRPAFSDPYDLTNIRTFGRSREQVGGELRARAVTAIEGMPGMADRHRETATRMVEEYDSNDGHIARHALIGGHPDYISAFGKLARRGGNDAELTLEERAAVARAMSLTDANGGYLVPFQLDPTIILTTDGSYNEIRKIARTVMATGDKWYGVSAGAVSWSFDAEAAEVSDDTPTFAQPTIDVHMARGFVPISIQAMQDAANVTTEVGRLLAQGKDDLEAAKFINGSGTNEPWGVVAAIAATDAASPDYTFDAAGEALTAADVYGLLAALPARYRMRASWLANNGIYNLVRQFASDDGPDLWERLEFDRPALLLGRPAYEAEAMDATFDPAATATNFVALAGDFSNYVIADRIGMQVELVPHLFATANNRPSGQRGWFAYYRVGADVVNNAAFRLLNIVTAA